MILKYGVTIQCTLHSVDQIACSANVLASFSGLPTIQHLAGYKNGREGPGIVYHVRDGVVYLGRS